MPSPVGTSHSTDKIISLISYVILYCFPVSCMCMCAICEFVKDSDFFPPEILHIIILCADYSRATKYHSTTLLGDPECASVAVPFCNPKFHLYVLGWFNMRPLHYIASLLL